MKPAPVKALSAILLAAALAAALPAAARHKGPRKDKNPVVVITTSLGTIKVELDEKKAPVTVKNFLTYVDEKFYDGTTFHRVIPHFMVQGGGFDKDMNEKPTHAPITNESQNGLKNLRGTLAMARTMDPNSATAQFFINVVDNAFLDYPNGNGGYAVFGKVLSGMDVVDTIVAVPTTNSGNMQNVPETPVIIDSIRRAD